MCLRGSNAPIDAVIFSHARVRLYPRTNRCEKAVVAGEQFWDREERNALTASLQAASATTPFVFIDLGANVGLYALHVWARAKSLGKPVLIKAIEPDSDNFQCLKFNLSASSAAQIDPLQAAVGGHMGQGVIRDAGRNRGERRVIECSGGDVQITTIQALLGIWAVDHVDALKIDIEGDDYAALASFFSSGQSEEMWPKTLIVETGRTDPSPMVELCLANKYVLALRTRMNAILARRG
jgi:FkbM family methyltransferase